MTTPGSTHAVALATSISWMRFHDGKSKTTLDSVGTAPPDRPVPAPRGTTAKPSSLASVRIAATSSASCGITIAAGVRRRSGVASDA